MSSKKKYTIVAITVVLITIVFLGFTNQKLIVAHYYNYKVNHFSKGDKVYVFWHFVNNIEPSNLPLMRLVKSTTSSDFKLISSGNEALSDSMRKYKSSYIGNYIGYKIYSGPYKNKNVMQCVYAITPNWKVINKTASTPEPLPANYVFADNNFYVSWRSCENKEVNKF